MSKVFDALKVAQKTKVDAENQSSPIRDHNIVPMDVAGMRHWVPEVPADTHRSKDKFYIAAIIILVAALAAMTAYTFLPQTDIGRGGENAQGYNRDDIELAIQNSLNSSSRSSYPTDPVNLAVFAPVTDSADLPKSGEEVTGSPASAPQTSTNPPQDQAQTTVPPTPPVTDQAPTPVNPPRQSQLPLEKGQFVISEGKDKSTDTRGGPNSGPSVAAGSKKDIENHLQLALFHHRNGDILKAYQEYEYVLKYDPYNLDAHNNMGLIFQEIGKYDEALKEFGKVLGMDPKNVQAINNSGVTYYKMQNYTAAVRRFEAALEIEPNNPDSFANLGLVYTQLDRINDAKAAFLKVLSIDPRHSETHYNLAQLYEKTGKTKDAIYYYQKFLSYSGGAYSSLVQQTERHVEKLYERIQVNDPGFQ